MMGPCSSADSLCDLTLLIFLTDMTHCLMSISCPGKVHSQFSQHQDLCLCDSHISLSGENETALQNSHYEVSTHWPSVLKSDEYIINKSTITFSSSCL